MRVRRKLLNADHKKQRGRIPCEFGYRHKKRQGEAGNTYVSPMETWAESEIRLACKKENPNWDGESFDYGIACYQSALKAYKSLLEDEHSGFSWEVTREVLERLMRHEPLTPITDEDFSAENIILESPEFLKEYNLKSSIQCPRMSSLFRNEHLDGIVTYTDVDRYYCYDINNPNDTYSGGGAASILDEICPITMPYFPSKNKYKICCETFLVDKEMGDYDTKAYWRITMPTGEVIEVNKFFKEIKDGDLIKETLMSASYIKEDGIVIEGQEYTHEYQPTKWVEITYKEFEERRANRIDNINK